VHSFDVKSSSRSAWYWFSEIHTLGLGHRGVRQTELLLKTDTGTTRIPLGPRAFLTDAQVVIWKGDQLQVTGWRVMTGNSELVLAREIRKGNDTWVLRDVAGRPLWGSGVEAHRFWTLPRVLFAGVVVKVIAIATVVRH
jgi:hypothetical protein